MIASNLQLCADRFITEKGRHPDCPCCTTNSGTITGDSKMSKLISLTQGKFALVDDEDFKELSKHKWGVRKKSETLFYAGRNDWLNKKNHILTMQCQILNPPKGKEIDHKNGNGLDNRRCNLRICTHRQNLKNQKRQKNNKSGYKGVFWVQKLKKWREH